AEGLQRAVELDADRRRVAGVDGAPVQLWVALTDVERRLDGLARERSHRDDQRPAEAAVLLGRQIGGVDRAAEAAVLVGERHTLLAQHVLQRERAAEREAHEGGA